MRPEQVAVVPVQLEGPSIQRILRPALLPHEEDRRTRPVLPADDRVGVELLEVEPARRHVGAIRGEPVVVIGGAG